jgi:hypothetical protein
MRACWGITVLCEKDEAGHPSIQSTADVEERSPLVKVGLCPTMRKREMEKQGEKKCKQ